MKVVVLDRHRLIAEAIGALLAEVMGCDVLAIENQASSALATIRSGCPDLLVFDLNCCSEADRAAVVDTLLLANSEGRVILRHAHSHEVHQNPSLAACTIGTVSDSCGWEALVGLLIEWQQSLGERPLSRSGGFLSRLTTMDGLPPRERRMVLELGQGLLNKQIAHNLHLTPATVGTYRKTIAAKLGVSGAELVRCAVVYRCWDWVRSSQDPLGCESTAEPTHPGDAGL